jgi:hypothetical protein
MISASLSQLNLLHVCIEQNQLIKTATLKLPNKNANAENLKSRSALFYLFEFIFLCWPSSTGDAVVKECHSNHGVVQMMELSEAASFPRAAAKHRQRPDVRRRPAGCGW